MRDCDVKDSVLAVDLDGTLLRSDMLFECFWAALAQDWRAPVTAARACDKGIPALKREMALSACPDVTRLPYNAEVIARIEDWRAIGGRVVLVTASDQILADRVAAHLGLFDEVFGTAPGHNLKAGHKAAFLAERYGDRRLYLHGRQRGGSCRLAGRGCGDHRGRKRAPSGARSRPSIGTPPTFPRPSR